MGKKSFNIKYDPATDILNVAFGKAKKSVSYEQEPEVFVRVDQKTKEVVGLTILGFKKSFLATKQELAIKQPLSP